MAALSDQSTLVTATPFVADPDIRFLGTLEVPRALFAALPDHPDQRQTSLHAVNLLRSGVLNHSIDIHREVDMHILADDLDEVAAAFAALLLQFWRASISLITVLP